MKSLQELDAEAKMIFLKLLERQIEDPSDCIENDGISGSLWNQLLDVVDEKLALKHGRNENIEMTNQRYTNDPNIADRGIDGSHSPIISTLLMEINGLYNDINRLSALEKLQHDKCAANDNADYDDTRKMTRMGAFKFFVRKLWTGKTA